MSIILSEQELLARISEALRTAEECAQQMAIHRPEVGFMWEKMAQAFEVNRFSIKKLADEAVARTMREKGPVRQ